MLRNLTYALLTMGVVSLMPAMNIGQTASADDWDDRYEDYQEAREEYYEDRYEDYDDDWNDRRWNRRHRGQRWSGYRAPGYQHQSYYRTNARSAHYNGYNRYNNGCAPVRVTQCCR